MINKYWRKKMNKEQKWKEFEDKALTLVHKAQGYQNLVNRIQMNCRDMKSNGKYAHLLDLNARGTHLFDPIFQKLDRNYLKRDKRWAYNEYINGALVRIGNRTMTEEEYKMLENVVEEKLVDLDLDEKLKGLQKKINKKRIASGGVYWYGGPFYCHRTPRTECDPFNEGYKK